MKPLPTANAIGVTPFETPQSDEAIRAWLATRDDVSLVLWIGRHEGGQATAWLVGRSGLDNATEVAATNAVAGVVPASPTTRNGRPPAVRAAPLNEAIMVA